MVNENPRSKFFDLKVKKNSNDFLLIENEKPLLEVIVKMIMKNQLNERRNQVIRNDQVERPLMMKKSLKITMNKSQIMKSEIIKVKMKINQNEKQHRENQ